MRDFIDDYFPAIVTIGIAVVLIAIFIPLDRSTNDRKQQKCLEAGGEYFRGTPSDRSLCKITK